VQAQAEVAGSYLREPTGFSLVLIRRRVGPGPKSSPSLMVKRAVPDAVEVLRAGAARGGRRALAGDDQAARVTVLTGRELAGRGTPLTGPPAGSGRRRSHLGLRCPSDPCRRLERLLEWPEGSGGSQRCTISSLRITSKPRSRPRRWIGYTVLMSRRGKGRVGERSSRVVGYSVEVPEADEGRVEKILSDGIRSGVVTQFDRSRGYFWWNGRPGEPMRALRAAVGGRAVRR